MESEVQEYSKDPDAIMHNYDVTPINRFSYSKMINMNNRRISNAYHLIHLIKEELDDIQKGLNRFSYWFKNDIGKVAKWEKIGKDVYNLNNIKDRSRATRIMYMFARETKLPSYEDHYDVIEEDMIAEEEAKYELEGMRRKKEEKKERQKHFVGESISQLSHSQSMLNKSTELGKEYQFARKDTREEPISSVSRRL
jgi:alpha-galactosidase/6-phospho-beta-glucosidase family protein